MEDFGSRNPRDLVIGAIRLNLLYLMFNSLFFGGVFENVDRNITVYLVIIDVFGLIFSLYVYVVHFSVLKVYIKETLDKIRLIFKSK